MPENPKMHIRLGLHDLKFSMENAEFRHVLFLNVFMRSILSKESIEDREVRF